jgi:hypothetical protein
LISSWYLTILVVLITIGLTASLFLLTIIGWFPDLSSRYVHTRPSNLPISGLEACDLSFYDHGILTHSR